VYSFVGTMNGYTWLMIGGIWCFNVEFYF